MSYWHRWKAAVYNIKDAATKMRYVEEQFAAMKKEIETMEKPVPKQMQLCMQRIYLCNRAMDKATAQIEEYVPDFSGLHDISKTLLKHK